MVVNASVDDPLICLSELHHIPSGDAKRLAKIGGKVEHKSLHVFVGTPLSRLIEAVREPCVRT